MTEGADLGIHSGSALVTGATSGIGQRRAALALAPDGFLMLVQRE